MRHRPNVSIAGRHGVQMRQWRSRSSRAQPPRRHQLQLREKTREEVREREGERAEVEEGETDLRAWAMAEGVLARRLLVSVLTVGFNTYVEDDGSSSSPPCGAAGRAHTVFLVATIDGGSRHPRAMHPALCAFSRGRWTGEGAGGDGGAKGGRRRRGDWGRDG